MALKIDFNLGENIFLLDFIIHLFKIILKIYNYHNRSFFSLLYSIKIFFNIFFFLGFL